MLCLQSLKVTRSRCDHGRRGCVRSLCPHGVYWCGEEESRWLPPDERGSVSPKEVVAERAASLLERRCYGSEMWTLQLKVTCFSRELLSSQTAQLPCCKSKRTALLVNHALYTAEKPVARYFNAPIHHHGGFTTFWAVLQVLCVKRSFFLLSPPPPPVLATGLSLPTNLVLSLYLCLPTSLKIHTRRRLCRRTEWQRRRTRWPRQQRPSTRPAGSTRRCPTGSCGSSRGSGGTRRRT